MPLGTISDFGFYTTIVKEDAGVTHGYWFEIPTLPSLGIALNALSNLPPSDIETLPPSNMTFFFEILLRGSRRPQAGTHLLPQLNSTSAG